MQNPRCRQATQPKGTLRQRNTKQWCGLVAGWPKNIGWSCVIKLENWFKTRPSFRVCWLLDWFKPVLRNKWLNRTGPWSGSRLNWSSPGFKTIVKTADGAVFAEAYINYRTGFGAVVRDLTGTFIAGLTGLFDRDLFPKEAEALGLREVLRWIVDCQLLNVLVEIDSKEVRSVVCFHGCDWSEWGVIVSDCRALLN
ncbi:hypothetical protein GH714_024798 [Hevea brasiliensis]|uniref:RNase H type-1 domain-containing protein n=1 Tax=Hevea brasiliensis TaxID=3981 RepID=A0A6A6N237_HEVBR|nr:hypothetical protein GH714_024798 [Hevea brasiliensis]